MDIKIVFLLIFAFIMEIFFLSKDLSFSQNGIDTKKVSIEFQNSYTYNITPKNIDYTLKADKIQQLKNKKLFFKPVANIYDSNITKTVISDKAIYDDKTQIVTLLKGVEIIYENKRLSTNMLKYNFPKQIVLDSAPFVINSEEFQANGVHLYFDIKKSIIKAKNIKYNIYNKE